MGLRVGVQVIVSAMDGTPLADVQRIDLTFNAQPERIEDEVPLAIGVARRNMEDVLSTAEQRLDDWAAAVREHIDEEQRSEAEKERRRRERGDGVDGPADLG